MTGLIMTIQLLLALSFLVLIHEFGHYIAARAFGIRVEKFFIFFDAGAKLWSKKIGDTEFGIGWLPLGGYVKISGMIDESMDTDKLKEEPKDYEFRSKPAWQRLIVMVAGVVLNVIGAVLILTFINLHYVKEYLPVKNINEGIYAYPLAREAGLKHGDMILAINGKETKRQNDVLSTKLLFAEEIKVQRNGIVKNIPMPDTLFSFIRNDGLFIGFENFPFKVESVEPETPAYKAGLKSGDVISHVNNKKISSFGKFREVLNEIEDTAEMIIERNVFNDTLQIAVKDGRIGISVLHPKYETEAYSFLSAMKYGWVDAVESLNANIKGFSMVFSGRESARDNLAGPIGIAKVFGGQWDWARFWYLTAILSMVLALVNILPIPALDGGHVLLLGIEAISGRKLPDKAMEYIQIAGMIIIFSLMIFVIGNDILNLFR